jgi:ABC-type nickel/cobalt efflux system permease component RcnA
MAALTLLSSLAQAASAIAIVSACVVVFGIGSRQLGLVADTWLAPASYAAIAAIGTYIVFRGLRLWCKDSSDHQCCHAHGPSVTEAETLNGIRETALMVGSIALRPCTGALFVLVIALRFDVFLIGCLAVVTMGLGTAAFNLLVAWSGVAARRLSAVQISGGDDIRRVAASLHILGGSLIALASLTLFLQIVT